MESRNVVDKCAACGGKCCVGVIEVEQDDVLYPDRSLTEQYRGKRQMRTDKDNVCICLQDGKCLAYDRRPSVCQRFKVGSECCEAFFAGKKTSHDCDKCNLFDENGNPVLEGAKPKDMSMEDAGSIALAAVDLVERRLAEFGIVVAEGEEEDSLFDPILRFVEGKSNGNYRHGH